MEIYKIPACWPTSFFNGIPLTDMLLRENLLNKKYSSFQSSSAKLDPTLIDFIFQFCKVANLTSETAQASLLAFDYYINNEKDLKIQERIPNAKLIEVKIDNDEETEDEQIKYGQKKMEKFITETMKKIKGNKKYIDKNISRKFNKPIYIPDDFVIIIEDEEEE